MSEVKIMIGGQALRKLGSDRHTEDVDFAIFGDGSEWRTAAEQGDILDMNAHAFTREVWAAAKPVDGVADAQTLAELKGWALIQHCRQMNWAKVAADEYDLKFLGRECGIRSLPILAKFEGQAAKEAERELTAHLRKS
jgi:hypothetical protein